MTGYIRQSSGSIITGATINAGPLNNEFNAIQDAFNNTTGHSHDGTAGGGAQLDLTAAVTGALPIANGGTNADTEAAARVNLGVEIGADVQAYSADLDVLVSNPLTTEELTQLQGIDTVSISNTQWGYLGGLDQPLATTDSVTHVNGSFTGALDVTSSVTSNEVLTDSLGDSTGGGISLNASLLKDGITTDDFVSLGNNTGTDGDFKSVEFLTGTVNSNPAFRQDGDLSLGSNAIINASSVAGGLSQDTGANLVLAASDQTGSNSVFTLRNGSSDILEGLGDGTLVTSGGITGAGTRTSLLTGGVNSTVEGLSYSVNAGATASTPTSPSDGATVSFAGEGDVATTNATIVTPGLETIEGDATLLIDSPNQKFTLVYRASGTDWKVLI